MGTLRRPNIPNTSMCFLVGAVWSKLLT